MGDSEFVMQVLSGANETFGRRYKLKSLGYDVARVEQRVLNLFDIKGIHYIRAAGKGE